MSEATPLPDRHDLSESLDEHLDRAAGLGAGGVFGGLPRDDEGRPYLPDDGAADWALRKLAKHRRHVDEVQRMAQERIDAIVAWANSETDKVTGDINFFTDLLEGYHRRVLDEQAVPWEKKERKTINLPSGQLTARAGRPSVVVTDEDAMLAWLNEHRPGLTTREVIYKWSKAELRKALVTDEGRLVDAPDPDCPDCAGDGTIAGEGEDDGICGCWGGSGAIAPGVRVDVPGPTYDAKT